MIFTGYSEHSIDAKGRLSVPAKYRSNWSIDRDGSAWYALPWPGSASSSAPGEPPRDRAIHLYTEKGFERLAESWDDSLTPDPLEAELQASLFSFAERLDLDAQGRVRLPSHHLELTGLAGPVVLVGARSRLEIRSRDAWIESQNDRFSSLPTLARRRADARSTNE